jgi:streptomycin 6-kinase
MLEMNWQPRDDLHMEIRKSKSSDIHLLNQIMRLSKAHWGYDDPFLDAFMEKFRIQEEYLNKHGITIFLENHEGIGFFSFIHHDDQLLELDLFFLHPDYIGKGFGRQLWQAACEEARNFHVTGFTLWSDPNAETFYVKMGCKKIGVKKSPFMPNRYPPIMHYDLNINLEEDHQIHFS